MRTGPRCGVGPPVAVVIVHVCSLGSTRTFVPNGQTPDAGSVVRCVVEVGTVKRPGVDGGLGLKYVAGTVPWVRQTGTPCEVTAQRASRVPLVTPAVGWL
jgi:hypothetical protein